MGKGLFFNYWKIGVPLVREKKCKKWNMGKEGSHRLNYRDRNTPR